MPQGTPYNAFILPYPIRVDDFSNSSSTNSALSSSSSPYASSSLPSTANLYLLTHTHTDHLNGLAARSFGQAVVCSHDAKEMLLRHEVYAERSLRDAELRAENVRTFAHLRVAPQRLEGGTMAYHGSRDLLVRHHEHSCGLRPSDYRAYSVLHISTYQPNSSSMAQTRSQLLYSTLITVLGPSCE